MQVGSHTGAIASVLKPFPGLGSALSRRPLGTDAHAAQEHYLKTNPALLNGMTNEKEKAIKHLELVSKASDWISDGDLVDRMIHGSVLRKRAKLYKLAVMHPRG